MNAILICPDKRHPAGFARRIKPLALLPIMGRTLLDLWLEAMACEAVKHVTLLVADRPEQIRQAVGNGGRWGIKITVLPVATEPDIEQARAVFASDAETRVVKIDTLPDSPSKPLWESTEGLFDVMMKNFKRVDLKSCLTMRRIAPDVFVSTRAHIAPTAIIEGPAWIGPQVIIGHEAHIMPGSIIEKEAYIDRQATVRGSWIGPKTYVGAMTEISHSFAWANGLENWRLASFIEVTDDFLLASLKRQPFGGARSGPVTRLLALLLMFITMPLAILCMGWSRLVRRRAAFTRTLVILPPPGTQDRYTRTAALHGLNGMRGLFARWPELWLVWCGDMHLVGNRPLTPARAAMLGDEFEQLWLSSSSGVFSLADSAGDSLQDRDAALAHAAYYSVHRSFRLNLRILRRCLPSFLTLRPEHRCSADSNPPTADNTCNA